MVYRNRKRKQKNQPITWLIPNSFTRDLEWKVWRPSAILYESEASVSASLIHTTSEDSSDSDSVVSVASVKQALVL